MGTLLFLYCYKSSLFTILLLALTNFTERKPTRTRSESDLKMIVSTNTGSGRAERCPELELDVLSLPSVPNLLLGSLKQFNLKTNKLKSHFTCNVFLCLII